MDTINRVAMAVVGALLFLAAVLSLLLLVGAVTVGPGVGPVAATLRALAEVQGGAWFGALAVAVVAGLLGVGLFVVEAFQPFHAKDPFLVSEGELGRITIERASVCALGERVALGVSGVQTARTTVCEGPAGVSFRCRLMLAPESRVSDVGLLVQEAVRKAVKDQVGLVVAEVVVRARLAAPAATAARTAEPGDA